MAFLRADGRARGGGWIDPWSGEGKDVENARPDRLGHSNVELELSTREPARRFWVGRRRFLVGGGRSSIGGRRFSIESSRFSIGAIDYWSNVIDSSAGAPLLGLGCILLHLRGPIGADFPQILVRKASKPGLWPSEGASPQKVLRKRP